MPCFKLAINMAGAISAGAYTAGVLDFLTEALDEWYAARESWQERSAGPDAVPMHDVLIEAFSGASAGGMCAAIACVQTQQRFDHVRDVKVKNSNNRLFECWVNRIDIRRLLELHDLAEAPPVRSLLDCTVIEEIARFTAAPGIPQRRPYIADSLNLFVTLTNLRGIPYALDGVAQGSLEQTTCYYGDRRRFAKALPGSGVLPAGALPLPAADAPDAEWEPLRLAAMATGAFPLALAPRIMERATADYVQPLWSSCRPCPDTPPSAPPQPTFIPTGLATWNTLNVDGGVIDNDPFDLAHDYLSELDPATYGINPRPALEADRAVLTVAPFPAAEGFDGQYSAEAEAGLLAVAGRLVTALISQSRFFGESLSVMMDGKDFSRFVIAPDLHRAPANARVLQCGTLGAFGGFFEQGYREHDFMLGRRNCQQFLREHFLLPANNPVMQAGIARHGDLKRLAPRYQRAAPRPQVAAQGDVWIPIIPLCGTAKDTVPAPKPGSLSDSDLGEIVSLIAQRIKAVAPLLTRRADSWALKYGLPTAAWLAAELGKGSLKAYLRKQLP